MTSCISFAFVGSVEAASCAAFCCIAAFCTSWSESSTAEVHTFTRRVTSSKRRRSSSRCSRSVLRRSLAALARCSSCSRVAPLGLVALAEACSPAITAVRRASSSSSTTLSKVGDSAVTPLIPTAWLAAFEAIFLANRPSYACSGRGAASRRICAPAAARPACAAMGVRDS